MRLENRRILITGGGSGIGLETARLAVAEGARVAILDRSPASLQRARDEVPQASAIACDVSDEAAVARAVEQAAAELGGLDGVANVAGIGTRRSFEETTARIMMTDIAVNLMGPFLVCKSALPHLRRAGGGTDQPGAARQLAGAESAARGPGRQQCASPRFKPDQRQPFRRAAGTQHRSPRLMAVR